MPHYLQLFSNKIFKLSTMEETFPLMLIDLENQKPTQINKASLTLNDNGLIYETSFFADEPIDDTDKTLGIESVFNAFTIFAKKDKVSGIEKSYVPSAKCWKLIIVIVGFAVDIKVYFKRESQATELYDKIYTWLNNGE